MRKLFLLVGFFVFPIGFLCHLLKSRAGFGNAHCIAALIVGSAASVGVYFSFYPNRGVLPELLSKGERQAIGFSSQIMLNFLVFRALQASSSRSGINS